MPSVTRKTFFSRYLPIILAVLLLAAALFVFFTRPSANSGTINRTPDGTTDRTAPSPSAIQTPSAPNPVQAKLFVHPSLGFSFEYPSNFTVGSFEEGDGDVVLVQSPPLFSKEGDGGSSPSASIQIYAQAFNESGSITAARIKKDLPQQLIGNAQNISIGGQPALLFDSREDGIGQTKEVWFVHSGQLYRVTAPSSAADLLQSILLSWKFDQ